MKLGLGLGNGWRAGNGRWDLIYGQPTGGSGLGNESGALHLVGALFMIYMKPSIY